MARGLAIVALTAVALAGPLAGSATAATRYHSPWYQWYSQCVAVQNSVSNSHIGIVKPCYYGNPGGNGVMYLDVAVYRFDFMV
jgi:hypothetical protein